MGGLYSINCYIHSVHGSDSKSVLHHEHTDLLVKGNDDKEVHNTASPSRAARNTADREEAGSDDSDRKEREIQYISEGSYVSKQITENRVS